MLLEGWGKVLDFELAGWFVLGGGVGCYIVSNGHACMHAAGWVWREVVGLRAAQNHPEEKYDAWILSIFLSYLFKIFSPHIPVGSQDSQPDGHGQQHEDGGGWEGEEGWEEETLRIGYWLHLDIYHWICGQFVCLC